MMQVDARHDDSGRRVSGRTGRTVRRARHRTQRKALFATALLFTAAWAAAAQVTDPRFTDPKPGTLTVKVVLDGHFNQPGEYEGEKFEGTVHREMRASIYLDMATIGPGTPFPNDDPTRIYALGSDEPAAPNDLQNAAAAVEQCNGDQQCMMAVAMQMIGDSGDSGDSTPVFMKAYADWLALGQGGRPCFDGTALIRESYEAVSLVVEEGGGHLETATWTVTGDGHAPLPDTNVIVCDTQLHMDLRRGTYDLLMQLSPDLEVKSSRETKPRRVTFLTTGAQLVVLRQKVPEDGAPLSGSARFPGIYELADGSKVDVLVDWTFTPGQ